MPGSWSYFGTPVPGKKSDFLDPGTDFLPTGPAPGPGPGPRVFWPWEAPRTCILTIYLVLESKYMKIHVFHDFLRKRRSKIRGIFFRSRAAHRLGDRSSTTNYPMVGDTGSIPEIRFPFCTQSFRSKRGRLKDAIWPKGVIVSALEPVVFLHGPI